MTIRCVRTALLLTAILIGGVRGGLAASGPAPGPYDQGPAPAPPTGDLPAVTITEPAVVITEPAQGSFRYLAAKGNLVSVEGQVNVLPAEFAALTVNGQPVPVAWDGTFSTQVSFDWDPGPDVVPPPVGSILPIVAEVRDTRFAPAADRVRDPIAGDRVTVINGIGVAVGTPEKEIDALRIRARRSLFDTAVAGVASQVPPSMSEKIEGTVDGYPFTAQGTVNDLPADGLGEYGASLLLHQGYGEVVFNFDLNVDLDLEYSNGTCKADYDALEGHAHFYFGIGDAGGGRLNVYGWGAYNYPTYATVEVFLDDFHLDWVSCTGLGTETAVQKVTENTGAVKHRAWLAILDKAYEMNVFQMIENALAGVGIEDVLADALAPLGADVSTDLRVDIDPEGLDIAVDLGLGEPADPEYLLGAERFFPAYFAQWPMLHPKLPCGDQGCWFTTPTTGLEYGVGISTSPYLFNWYLRALAARGALDTSLTAIPDPSEPSQEIPLTVNVVSFLFVPGLLDEAPPGTELALAVEATAAPYLSGRKDRLEPPAAIQPKAVATGPKVAPASGQQFGPVATREAALAADDPDGIHYIPEYELWVPDLRIRITDTGYVNGWCGAADGVYLELAVDARLGLSLDRVGTSLVVNVSPPTSDDVEVAVVRAPCGFNPWLLDPNTAGALYLPDLIAQQFKAMLAQIDLPPPFEIEVNVGGASLALNDFIVHGLPDEARPFVLFLGAPPVNARATQAVTGNLAR
jgi:hypothetical protein